MMHQYFRLYACCLLVKGARRSLIADVQRDSFYLIPNALYTILTEDRRQPFAAILEKYGQDNRDTIQEYFDYLTKNEFIFWCEKADLSLFPDIPLNWEVPNHITNAIIDIDQYSTHDFEDIFRQLDGLGCKHLQVRSYCALPLSTLEELLKALDGLRIISVHLLTKATDRYTHEQLENLFNSYPRLLQLIFHSADNTETRKQAELSNNMFAMNRN